MYGWIIDCPGEDERVNPDGPSQEMIELGFKYSLCIENRGRYLSLPEAEEPGNH